MSAELFIRNADGDLQQIFTLPSEGWTVEESAEEGNASQTQIAIPDPDMSIDPDHIIGWRRAIIYERDSEVDNEVIFSGFVSIQDIGRSGGSFYEPVGRVWNVSLVDMNTLWDQRLLRGTDTKRPAETDVARMTWLVATEEMGYFDDTSLISSSDPENLDKRDTARTTCKSVADECSQQSGKNYWMGATSDGIFVWYGNDSLEDYESPLRLSNDPTDMDFDELGDGTSLVWPLSDDTKLNRDPNRVYDGAMIEYEGGAVYRKNTATSAFFTLSGRDIDVPAPEIKTKTKAQRRGDRMLADLDTQNEVLTTTVRIPKGKAAMIRAGMRIAVKATHLPGWEEFGWARILTCSITAVQAGAYYDLGLKLQGPTTPGVPVLGDTFAAILGGADNAGQPYFRFTGDVPPGGWFLEPLTGPIELVQSVSPFTSIRALSAMTVRIELQIDNAAVLPAGQGGTLSLLVNGVAIGSESNFTPGGFWALRWNINVNSYLLNAGDIVSFSYSGNDPGWGDSGSNETYLRIGRGTFFTGSSTWVGP